MSNVVGLLGDDEFAEVVEFTVHVGGDKDACHGGDEVVVVVSGSGRRREESLEEMPCQFRVVAVLQNTLHQLPRLIHNGEVRGSHC